MPQSWRLAMSTFTRRQFNRTLMASVGSVWARDVVGNRASQANQQQTWAGSIADVPGIKAGHYTDSRRPTGCTALLFEGKGTAGVDYDGSAPGSHLGVLLQPVSPIDTIHGLLLTGGGPMGLSAVAGAVRYLEEHKTGFDWGIPNVRIPMVVANSVGDILDRQTGKIVAGALRHDGKGFANISETLRKLAASARSSTLNISDVPLRSTTLVVVATNVSFTKTELTKIAMMASTGVARAINPYHTNGDGDSTFAVSTNRISSDLGISVIGALAADLVSETVVRAVTHSKSVEGWVAVRDLQF